MSVNLTIRPKRNEKIEKTLKRFKRELDGLRIFQDLRERERFEKPSVKRRKKSARAEARRRKEAKELRLAQRSRQSSVFFD
jgi:small subunit ribosomal protein S21